MSNRKCLIELKNEFGITNNQENENDGQTRMEDNMTPLLFWWHKTTKKVNRIEIRRRMKKILRKRDRRKGRKYKKDCITETGKTNWVCKCILV